jgi:hypothetical protein
MGVLYDYFRAPEVDQVRDLLDENDGFSPVERFEGIDLKWIDPGVILGKLVGFATGQEWSTSLVIDRLIWPVGAEQEMDYQGPWVTILNDEARDTLADIPVKRVAELAERWATVEEFRGYGDAEYLREVIAGFIGLAARAREHGESLFCWICL